MNGNTMKIAAAFAAGLMLAGCEKMKFGWDKPKPAQPARRPAGPDLADAIKPPGYLAKAGLKTGFQRDDGAVNDAVVWMERYTKESEKRNKFEMENQALAKEKQTLSGKLARLETDLDQAKREISEANAMMLQLDGDLKAWKNNVLGYRDEARRQHRESMDSLARIMKLLGAEPQPTALYKQVTTGGPTAKQPAAKAKEPPNVSAGS